MGRGGRGLRAMNDEGRDGAHAKPANWYSQQGTAARLLGDTLKLCIAAFLCVGSGRV